MTIFNDGKIRGEFMRRIFKLNENHIDKYADITFRSYPSFKDFSTKAMEEYKKHVRHIMENHKDVSFYGAFDDGEMVGVMRLFDFKMNLFGKIVETSGVGFLGVDPVHKKKKVALDLIKFYERHYRTNNLPIALLLPFKTDFYKLMGYGFGTKLDQYRIATKDIPAYKKDSNIKYVMEDKEFNMLMDCRKNVVAKRHGMAMKLSGEIEDMKNISSTQIVANYNEENLIDGYISFEFQNTKEGNFNANNIYVHELVYENPDALMKLLGFLRKQEDQVQLVIFNTKDENFHYLFGNPTNDSRNHVDFGHIETNTQSIGIMYKLLDVKSAFKQVSYRNYNNSNLKVRFFIEDDYLDDREKFIVNFNNGFATTDCDEYDVTVSILLSDFSSLFMGSTSVNALHRLGLLELDDESYLEQLNMTFYTPEKPDGNIDF